MLMLLIAVAMTISTTQLILASVNLYYPDYLPKPWHTVLTSWGLIIVVGTIAILGQKALPKVDGFMIVWITAGVLATAITLPRGRGAPLRCLRESDRGVCLERHG
jgi:hypothetical protein